METPPRVIVVTGPPGSGKTTTGFAVARFLGAAVLDQDSMTNPLVDVLMGAIGASDYSDARLATLTRDARYECLTRVALDCVDSGIPVVMIAPFTSERADPAAWSRLADRFASHGSTLSLAWIRIDGEELAHRLVDRGAARDKQKLAHVHEYVRTLDLDPPRTAHIELDGATPPDVQVETLISRLDR